MLGKPVFGTPVSVAITLAGLATSSGLTAGRAGALHRHDSGEYDCLIQFMITTGTSPAASQIELWLSTSLDGTNFSGGATGADAALTPAFKANMHLLDVMAVTTSSDVTYRSKVFSIRRSIGFLPPFSLPFVTQNTGANLNATAGNHFVKLTPIR